MHRTRLRFRSTPLSLLAASGLTLLLTGCGSLFKQPNPDKVTFLLPSMGGLSGADAEAGSGGSVVAVRPFRIAAEYSDKSLTYRLGPVEMERDYYNTWLVSPDAMVTERLREWLTNSGLVSQVQDSGSLVLATHIIEGNLTELGGDYSNSAAPQAVVALRLTLLPVSRAEGGGSLLNKSYRAVVPIKNREPASLVAGLGEGLSQIFSEFGADVRKELP